MKDHCGIWRCFVAIVLLTGVMILSRPPALFPAPTQLPIHNHSRNSNNTEDLNDHGEAYEGNYELIGVLSALAVPTLSAWIVIITR